MGLINEAGCKRIYLFVEHLYKKFGVREKPVILEKNSVCKLTCKKTWLWLAQINHKNLLYFGVWSSPFYSQIFLSCSPYLINSALLYLYYLFCNLAPDLGLSDPDTMWNNEVSQNNSLSGSEWCFALQLSVWLWVLPFMEICEHHQRRISYCTWNLKLYEENQHFLKILWHSLVQFWRHFHAILLIDS